MLSTSEKAKAVQQQNRLSRKRVSDQSPAPLAQDDLEATAVKRPALAARRYIAAFNINYQQCRSVLLYLFRYAGIGQRD